MHYVYRDDSMEPMARTITHIDNDETKPALFGGRDHLEVAQNSTFTQMVFELLTQRAPSENETKMLDLILNLSIDHGPNAPSAVATINAAKEGKTVSEALAAGILQINERHGGAGEPLMEILYKLKDSGPTSSARMTPYHPENPSLRHPGKSMQPGSVDLVAQYLKEGKRLPGLGHRVYKDKDPRAELIMDKAIELGVGVEFVKITKELKEELFKQSGKSLPINIDGALAAVLCGFGLKPEVGIAVFIIARTPGLIGQYLNNS